MNIDLRKALVRRHGFRVDAVSRALAAQLAPRFGLGQTVSGEDWHFEVVDEATARTYPRGFTVDAEAKARFDQLDRNMAVLLERTSGQKKLLTRIWNKLKPAPAGQV
jgi:hypothetical protein